MLNKMYVILGFNTPSIIVIDNNILTIKRAVEPSDVIWENFGYFF
jgi:hypothetical protein